MLRFLDPQIGVLTDSPSDTFEINRERAIDYLNTRDNVYVFDGYAGVCLPVVLSNF